MNATIGFATAWGVVVYDAALAVFHLWFARLFGWPTRLPASGEINAAITRTLNAMLIYVFVAYAVAIAWRLSSGGGVPPAALAIGTGFWLLRAALQPRLFRLRRATNVRLTLLWLIGAALHGAAALALP